MNESFQKYVEQNSEKMYLLLKELAQIPAPSGNEEKRAEYVAEYLHNEGLVEAYVDEALNVIYPINTEGKEKITVFAAHTDVVFGFDVPMNYTEKDGKVFCPGIGDDTASVVVLMMTAMYFAKNGIKPNEGVLFVFNSCEEGMGNLKGVKQLMKDYKGRIKEFVTYDSDFYSIANECVGSHRYKVTALTKGGHSFSKFGNENAIAELSKIVTRIYRLKVPKKDNATTTYNVGTILGGTSVNTIAQSASMLCEYRSDDRECLEIMKKKFLRIFKTAQTDNVTVEVEVVGERPCSDVDRKLQDDLAKRSKRICDEVYGTDVYFRSGSTDCNIPLSMGIPAVNVGVYIGGGAHTREEWIEKSSLLKGLMCSLYLTFDLCDI